ncbi:DHA1 family inner membrane transport protein [Rhizobium leguminosarum]|uniref:DHA1 family inner membrane transport protein n=1 Tax=Rhizobium leguminosarum TaxID=384 RepID=A0AAE2MKP7_RHILE|nr:MULTISPECIES: MFS transporter [Rhizobium]MBB4291218.1 DHA1 family inner membrane transport protein [Rhizobium leguminosarum]MBB4297686.1 DHA1 family inner membrane transport protein [Rhizobium leguminosarum]MBB4308826.1 DHA1 family inner membrane transport protein [Rhizobium leguminosarum]MBB4416661.1 DHA1 family inner membrane transport protein [Rhizobium leguminosarum]MBB4430371.1 DHA1 family inner membrane transport protein [Rhizobium esperanzae]
MPLALLVLALSSFAIGTTEFVIMGLLPEVAADLSVSIPQAGWLVTGYALAVAIGAPVMAISTAKLKRRTALIALMAFFIAGNLLCALASDYWVLMIARIVTALCHGAFFGIGSVVAAGLVAEDRKARAVALMFTGLTLANVLGVPLGTAIGQAYGWRATFGVVTIIGVVTISGLIAILPRDRQQENGSILREIAALRNGGLWLALSTTVFFAASMFALFTYIAPLLRDVTGVSPEGVTWTLFLIGLGLTVGNLIGGKLADWRLGTTLAGVFAAIAVTSIAFSYTSRFFIPAEITLFLWALASFAAVPALQVGVVGFGKDAPNLASTINIGAFNTGNALGAWVGGLVIDAGFDLTRVPLAAALMALIGLGATTLTYLSARGRATLAPAE